MNELQVIVKQNLGSIDFNFKEIKENLTNMMELYKDAQFTEETSSDAKKEVATLRKIKKALNDRRIEVKKEYMQPYDDFETKVEELTSLIDKPIRLIDTQVQVFEEKRKAEKKQKIYDIYSELIGDLGDYLPISKIYDSKWENVSVSIKSIRDEIEQVISSTDMAVNTIKGMNSEVVTKALEQYRQNLSLADAISYINKHEQMKAEILAKEEQKRKEEEERKCIAEENRIREQERQRVLEEERKRITEENRIREEERQKILDEERQRLLKEERERKATEELLQAESAKLVDFTSALPCHDEFIEEPFEIIPADNDSFTEEPFIIEPELPFVTVGETKAVFTVIGSFDEIEQVELYLNSIGLFWERNDE